MRKPVYLSPGLHKPLWVCLLGLTIAIILWPVYPSPYDPMPVQSIYAIQNLPWFIVLFLGWTLVLAALLFLVRGGVLERLALCLVFALVFVQFWNLASPWGMQADTNYFTGMVLYLQDTGQIPPGGHHSFSYFDYPGLALEGISLLHTTGMDVFRTVQVFLLANTISFVLILYVAFLKLLRTPSHAALGVTLAFASGQVLAVVPFIFHPVTLATTYIALFLLLQARSSGMAGQHMRDAVLLILLVMAATVEYIFTPVLFLLIMLSSYVLHRILKVRGSLSFNIFLLTSVLFFSWLVFVTVITFQERVLSLHLIIADFQDGRWLLYIQQELYAQVGQGYPWWGTASRLFWWFTVLGLGTALVLRRMFSLRKADAGRRLEAAWLLGLVATVVIGSVGIPGVVHGGLSRYIWVAPFFLVPAIIDVLRRPAARRYAMAFALIGPCLLLPNFLSNADTVSRDVTYRHEVAAAKFIASTYGKGEGLVIYSNGPGALFPLLYTPGAYIRMAPEARGITEEHVWSSIRAQLRGFYEGESIGVQPWIPIPGYSGYSVLFLSSWKMRTNYWEKVGIPPDDPNWGAVEAELSAADRMIYDSGYLQLYQPPPPRAHDVSFWAGR